MTTMNAMEDLNALLEERSRYEKWIAQLNAKREQTPPHVFERVRTDYATRLDTVMGQLRSQAEGLQATVTTLEARVNALASEEQLRRDARAEIELDRKSTRLNSSHLVISYAVFCLKKKKTEQNRTS